MSRIAVITGAASGIGAATARRLTADGLELCLVDRDVEALRHLAVEVNAKLGGRRRDGAPGRRARARGERGRRRARHRGRSDRPADGGGDVGREWDAALALNLTATFRFCRAAIPAMRGRGGGAIVTVGSGWASSPARGRSPTPPRRRRSSDLTRALAIDHGPDGIRANCVCPGDTDTPLLRDEVAQLGEEADAGSPPRPPRPLGRVAAPAEIAAAVAWLRVPGRRPHDRDNAGRGRRRPRGG